MATLERAIQIAHEAHEGQTRYDGSPYVNHPLRVMAALALDGYSEKTQIVGVLHDVVEDNKDWTIERLRGEGFEEDILVALDKLDKKDLTEEEYIDEIAKDELAKPAKDRDMEDNLKDNPTPKQVIKYTRRRARLAIVAAGVRTGV